MSAKHVFTYYESSNELQKCHQKTIVLSVVKYFVHRQIKLSLTEMERISIIIENMFPTEDKVTNQIMNLSK